MIQKKEDPFFVMQKIVQKENSEIEELGKKYSRLDKAKYENEKTKLLKEIEEHKKHLAIENDKIPNLLTSLFIPTKLSSLNKDNLSEEEKERLEEGKNYYEKDVPLRSVGGKIFRKKELYLLGLEKETVRRIRQKEKTEEEKKKEKKTGASSYSKVASILFSNLSKSLLGKDSFKDLEKDLIKANLDYSPIGYMSMILLTTLISFMIGGFIFLFFLFFDIGSTMPWITRAIETINVRFLKVFWILIVVPIITFLVMYFFPYLEKKANEARIEEELPFATIHMSAISGSMIDPVKIFEIIVLTGEYPALQKEFVKLLNEINLYGSDFVNALRNRARNTSSKKLAELYNGLSTTINSGGDLTVFFSKRSETLLFEYQIEIQKAGKAAETFMDVYISVVIAAPMILMILLMMMKMSGMGLSMSVGMITMIMVLAVVAINVVFLMFLHMKRKR
jgi:heme/copper-type cytochrome/quinol oxidase subunit 4